MIEKAQAEVVEKAIKVNREFLPVFHAVPPEGWINDPNGFSCYNGKIHLFYQFNPHDTVWGDIHWGHWTSSDFVTWENEPIALATDMPYDCKGVFSGTGLVEDGKLYVMYTGVCEDEASGKDLQQQCIAFTSDGVHFEKFSDNPVISASMLPEEYSPYDFRDPKIEKIGNIYRVIMAVRSNDGGKLISYTSSDMHKWTYEGVYIGTQGAMTECPDSFTLSGERVAVFCIMEADTSKYPSKQLTCYAVGKESCNEFLKNGENGDSFWQCTPVDWGMDFYAPETVLTEDGRRIMTAWVLSWGQVYPTHTLHHGWAGMMTLPRELSVKNGVLIQSPVREIRNYRGNEQEFAMDVEDSAVEIPQCKGKSKEIQLRIDMRCARNVDIRLMNSGDEYFSVKYSMDDGVLTASREKCGYPMTEDFSPEEKPFSSAHVSPEDGKLNLHIFIDNCIVEIFAECGAKVLTSLAFPKKKEYGVSICASGCASVSGTCWDIS